MRYIIALFGIFALSACLIGDYVDGFKDIKFGMRQSELEHFGFICAPDIGECKAVSLSTHIAITSSQLSLSDPEHGRVIFGKCAACHEIAKAGSNGIGPNLWGVVGAPAAATARRFAFSEALSNKGSVWDVAALDKFLSSPREFAPGTKMTFAGLSNPADRVDVIAYLNSQSSAPIQLAAPPNNSNSDHGASKAKDYTLFGKSADVTPRIKNGRVDSIKVSVALPVDKLIKLLTEQYGEPVNFSEENVLGARYNLSYWLFENGTSIYVSKMEAGGLFEPTELVPELKGIGVEDYKANRSSVEYQDVSLTQEMRERAKGKTIDPSDT